MKTTKRHLTELAILTAFVVAFIYGGHSFAKSAVDDNPTCDDVVIYLLPETDGEPIDVQSILQGNHIIKIDGDTLTGLYLTALTGYKPIHDES